MHHDYNIRLIKSEDREQFHQCFDSVAREGIYMARDTNQTAMGLNF
ncbi:hypothetical protein [Spirochaeta isovalerica]|uniref:Uncharacterized protein n=1 Tax=Spirochaeta isovalerica TaxID=150 RepID=A0A841R950_9SPIO|nr:hypothetical protein [Spirochaeta isovalerica]MBB6480435.1 hypothetical protein [Spirochaeta isovalerica]